MNGNGFVKFLLTVLILAVIYFGWVLTGALDRVRESNLRVLERLEQLQHSPLRRPPPATTSPTGSFSTRRRCRAGV